MNAEAGSTARQRGIGFFEKYLTVWVVLCVLGGIVLGRLAPDLARQLDDMAIHVGEAHVVSIPIALCLFFMMYPIMVKIDFAEVIKAGRSLRPVGLTLVINWAALLGRPGAYLTKMQLGHASSTYRNSAIFWRRMEG